MANNRGSKRKITDSCTEEQNNNAPALRRRLIDQAGLLGHCFPQEPRFGTFLPVHRTHGDAEKSSSNPQRRKLKLPNKLGRPALWNMGTSKTLASASSKAAQDLLNWDAPEFAEEPSTSRLDTTAAARAETNVDLPANLAGLPSSTSATPATAVSSPLLAKMVGHSAVLGNDLGTPSSAAAAHQPAPILPAADAPGLNPAISPAAVAPAVPEHNVSSAGDTVQSFAFGKPLSTGGPLDSGGPGQLSGNKPLAVFGEPQHSGAAALQTQNAPQQTMPPGPLFGQIVPEQVLPSRFCVHWM